METQLVQIQQLKTQNPQLYIESLQKLVNAQQKDEKVEDQQKIQEKSIILLSDYYIEIKKPDSIFQLIQDQKKLWCEFPKAKSAKIIRKLIDQVALINGTYDLQVNMCQYLIKWCEEEKTNYLKLRVQLKLCQLYFINLKFQNALDIISGLLTEVRKQDDKHMLVETYLIESKIYFSLENFAKSKASLTAARAIANQIYIAPRLQAEIDLQSGILHQQELDYKTAYSYFYESFESFNNVEDKRALALFKYMLIAKIMNNLLDDVNLLLNGKYGLKYACAELEAIKQIVVTCKKQSLIDFTSVIEKNKKQIITDENIKLQIDNLYNKLLEQNLFKLIEPYSKVQIDYIAKKMNLQTQVIQKKLSELILDKKIDGTLDQGNGCLILFNDIKCDELYPSSIDLLKSMGVVVDKLFERAQQLKN